MGEIKSSRLGRRGVNPLLAWHETTEDQDPECLSEKAYLGSARWYVLSVINSNIGNNDSNIYCFINEYKLMKKLILITICARNCAKCFTYDFS